VAWRSLRKHDTEWVENYFPNVLTRRGLHGPRYDSPRAKSKILKAINSTEQPSRAQIWRMEKHAMLWATKHCPEWLQSVLPPSHDNR
jgi:hypothetical protein